VEAILEPHLILHFFPFFFFFKFSLQYEQHKIDFFCSFSFVCSE